MKENTAVAFIEPVECVSSYVKKPEVYCVNETINRELPDFLQSVFTEGCENLTD